MIEQTKYKKYILGEYSGFSDMEIISMIEESLPKYIKLVISEDIAIDILKSYNITKSAKINDFKFLHNELILCAELRKIEIPKHLYDVKVNLNDIVERIKEFCYQEIRDIMFIKSKIVMEDEDSTLMEETLKYADYDDEIRIMEVCTLYNKIIDKVVEDYNAKILLTDVKLTEEKEDNIKIRVLKKIVDSL